MSENLLSVSHIKKSFSLEAGFFAKNKEKVYAVNDVSFSIERGKTYGLVGESGCGKTTTARIIVGMYKADSGEVTFNSSTEKNPAKKTKKETSSVRYIFQDPARSLNPRMTVYSILTAAYRHSKMWPGKKIATQECEKLLEEVGLDKSDLNRRPSEFSGGQRQRISIARALIMKPELLICDEVVSALDVSIQAQILNLLQDLRSLRNLSFLFIAHDLRVSCYFCDTIGVMYAGMLVEEAEAKDLYKTAAHPYTKLLFGGLISNEVRTVLSEVKGCPFAHRCPKAEALCFERTPAWKTIAENHKVRCHKI